MRFLVFVFTIYFAGCVKKEYFEMPDLSYMEPAVVKGDIFYAKSKESIDRFDLVLIENIPGIEGVHILRVIGLPNEKVVLSERGLMINDELNDIPKDLLYLKERLVKTNSGKPMTYKVGEDKFFLLGDNVEVSYDSRYFGAISIDQIIGPAIKI
jgi:signal peptidase I